MPLPASGQIDMGQVNTELTLSATAQISLNDAAVRTLFGISSGAIDMNTGHGKSNAPIGQAEYVTEGTYSWTAPAGCTSVSVVCVGSGSSGGGGGGLGYKNNYSVTPGNSYTVVVGKTTSIDSYFVSTAVVKGGGTVDYNSGLYTGDGGGRGGTTGGVGGGGAGGYSGNGGNGPNTNINNPGYYLGAAGAANSGAAGGGSCISESDGDGGYNFAASGGGGVGLLGQGSTGAATPDGGTTIANGGRGGSSGANGTSQSVIGFAGASGGLYGGGANGIGTNSRTLGAVRIIWPGATRQFPSTNTANM